MVTLQTIATSRNTPEVRSLPSPGITRLPRYYEPVRLPAKPEPSLAGVPLALHVPLDRVSRVARLIPLLRAVTITPAGPGRGVRRSPEPWLRPSPSVRRVGSCNARFRGLHGVHMCCQQTSQHGITARKLAEWLNHPLTPKASYGFVTSTITSAASGWNDRVAGWVSHPQDKPNLCTAHAPKVRNVLARIIHQPTRDRCTPKEKPEFVQTVTICEPARAMPPTPMRKSASPNATKWWKTEQN
jgi:hypothetical protein